jgi:histidyl-tRNA synthetase
MTAKTLQTLKEFRDFLPERALQRDWLKEQIVTVFQKWGFDPLETPTLEPLELFEGQIGEDEKLFFKFKDPGKRDVALRYDQTVPTCRVVGQYVQQLAMPFRRYQIQPAFRAENTQRGRYREFLQCDADIFGTTSPYADAELIALSLDIYKTLGFPKVTVLINDRSLLKDIPYDAIVAIDKLKKIGKDGVIQDMVKKGISEETAETYFTKVQSLQPNDTIRVILEYLKNAGFPDDWYVFEPTLARSFSYSSGPIWEIEIPGFKGSVLGGERFDNLVAKISNNQIPGTGFGLGFDRTLEAAEQFELIPQLNTNTKVLVTVFGTEMQKYSLALANSMRKAQINTELYPDPSIQIGKQLKYASKKEIPYVVIAGDDEMMKKEVIIKNMKTGEQVVMLAASLEKKAVNLPGLFKK